MNDASADFRAEWHTESFGTVQAGRAGHLCADVVFFDDAAGLFAVIHGMAAWNGGQSALRG